MINAGSVHMDEARVFEARGQLDEALREYRRANEFHPTSRVIASKVQELERRVREQLEASQPKPSIQQMRERARQEGAPPLLNLTTKLPTLRFTNSSVRDILNFIGSSTGLNVTYDRDYQDRSYTVQLDNISLDEALGQVLAANGYFYKVINDHAITVIPETPQKRAQYEEQVIRTFYVSHADATELAQLLTTMIRLPNMAVQPRIVANKAANTITVGATGSVVAIIEKIIESNDNPRAEVVVDVQILEINRSRAKQFGLDLGSYAVAGVFSPEADARPSTGAGAAAGGSSSLTAQPFNLNSVSRGINTGDFYLSVPSAVVRFLENDTETKLIAKPQLRGAEGQKITLNLGDDIPVPSTVFTPFAQGGANINPLTSFNYKTVGVVVEMMPRVTFEDDIILELTVERSSLGPSITIGGQALPSFGTRKVQTKLRLRDGESNLLAGLLREDKRKSLKGFPSRLRLPILKQLLSANDNEVKQTDIVMLLTPRLVRTHELTQQDVSPIFIGTQQNLGLAGPPPLIAQAEPAAAPAPTSPAPPVAPSPPPRAGDPAREFVGSGDHNTPAGRAGAGAEPAPGAAVGGPVHGDLPGTGAADGAVAGSPDGGRAVHAADLRRQCGQAVCRLGHADLQPGRVARAGGAGGQLHAPGWKRGTVHAAGGRGCRPHRFGGDADAGRDRGVGGGAAGGRALRYCGTRGGEPLDDGLGHGLWGRCDGAAVRAGGCLGPLRGSRRWEAAS